MICKILTGFMCVLMVRGQSEERSGDQFSQESLANCISLLIEVRPDLTEKLNEEQLGHMCRNLYQWPHDTPQRGLSLDSGTVNQRKWRRIVECRGAECLKSIIARKCPGGVCPEDDPFIRQRRPTFPRDDVYAESTKAPWISKDFPDNNKGPVNINTLGRILSKRKP